MAILLTASSLITLSCLTLLLLQAQSLNAQYVVNEDFITKNGTRVKLSLIRRYLKYATDEQLSHMVFQFDAETQQLTSHHRLIRTQTNTRKTRIKKARIPDRLQTSKFQPFFLRKTLDGSFIYNQQNSLVAAWGDTLDMHSLNSINHPDIYINHFQTPDNSEPNADGISNRPNRPQCTEEYNLAFAIRFDKELCARYGNSYQLTLNVLQLFVRETTLMIQDITCVNINVLSILGACHNQTTRGQFDWPSLPTTNCTGTNTANHDCDSISESIMEKVKKDFQLFTTWKDYRIISKEYRDMRLVFSGLQGTGPLAGIAYRAQACNANHGYSWISGISRIALYHEAGHMLGANHDEVGIMRSKLRVGENLLFSDRSRSEMLRFVATDPRSWCLRRKLGRKKDIEEVDGWGPAISVPKIMHNGKRLALKDMALASLTNPSAAKHDLILGYRTLNGHSPPRLFLRVFPNILTPNGSLSLQTGPVQLIDIEPDLKPGKNSRYKIGVGHIAHRSSNDVVLLYVAHNSPRSGIKSHVPYYHVGFDMTTTNGPTHWTPALPIDAVSMQPALNRWREHDIWVGHVRTANGSDLVYTQLEESYSGGVIASYKIGFNLSLISGKPTEWSRQYRIPGEFPKNTHSFSISVIDIDGNGKPDIVYYVQIISIPNIRFNYASFAFIRVGKDLDSTGRVTNGWTRFKRVPNAEGMGISAIDTASGMNSFSPPVVMTLTRVSSKREFRIMAGKNVLTPELMSTGRSESSIEALNEGCHRCYKSDSVRSCINDVEHCRAQVDELNIEWSKQPVDKGSETSLRASNLVFNKFLSVKSETDTAGDSMFCLGFHELRKKDSGCDVVDVITVLGKGLEIALANAITTTLISSGEIDTRSMFENPAATSDNGLPIIVQITIEKSVNSTLKGAIREAERRMRTRFPSFQRVFNQNKVGREERSGKTKWIIKYYRKNGFTYDDVF